MVIHILRRLFGRDSTRQKQVAGSKLDIYMSNSPENDPLRWHYVEEAAYIPTNDRNLLSQSFAEELELEIRPDGTAEANWKLSADENSYKYRMKFEIRLGLPCRVIFGEYDSGGGNPFVGAVEHNFDESYVCSKRVPRSNSWRKLVNKTSSWGYSDRPKDGSRRPSFLLRTLPAPITNTFVQANPMSPKLEQFEVPNAARPLYNGNEEPAVEKTSESEPILIEGPTWSTSWECESSETNGKFSSAPFPGNCKADPLHVEPGAGLAAVPAFPTKPQNKSTKIDSIVTNNTLSESPEFRHHAPQNLIRFEKSEENTEKAISQQMSENSELDFKPPGPQIPRVVDARSFLLQTESGSKAAKPYSSKLGSEEIVGDKTEVHHFKVSGTGDQEHVPLNPSAASAESSSNAAAIGIAAAIERPRNHGKITSYGVERFLESPSHITHAKEIPVEFDHTSDHLSNEQASRPREQVKKFKKRGRGPKLQRVKLNVPTASQNVDLSPAPGAYEYWTYDDAAKAYCHVDSDTQSVVWYEDSDSEEINE